MDRLTDVIGEDNERVLKCVCEYEADGKIADISPCSDYCKKISRNMYFTNCEECGIMRAIERLSAYEDTGLSPADVVILKARSEDSFVDHLNTLCDIKDKQISELFIENQRLKKLLDEIENTLKGE